MLATVLVAMSWQFIATETVSSVPHNAAHPNKCGEADHQLRADNQSMARNRDCEPPALKFSLGLEFGATLGDKPVTEINPRPAAHQKPMYRDASTAQ